MPCGGAPVLDEAIALFSGSDQPGADSAIRALRQVRRTHEEPAPLFRSLAEFKRVRPAVVQYRELASLVVPGQGVKAAALLSSANCHRGQRKLALTLLDFLARVGAREGDHLVYVGASSFAAHAAAAAFPAVRQTLYDPDRNLLDLMPKGLDATVVPRAGPGDADAHVLAVNGFFSDETVSDKLGGRLRRGERVLFVSDIRLDSEDEGSIRREMLAQQGWALALAADFFMFKFRLPYDSDLTAPLAHYGQAARRLGYRGKPAAGRMPYLRGELLLQPYPPAQSGELRLVGSASKPRFLAYDVADIEAHVNTFNVFWRSHAAFSHAGAAVSPYDLAAEAAILGSLPADRRGHAARALGALDVAACGLRSLRKSGLGGSPLAGTLAESCGQGRGGPPSPRPGGGDAARGVWVALVLAALAPLAAVVR